MNRSRLVLGIWLGGLALCVIIIMGTRFTTDMSAFLPRSPTATQQMLVDQLHNGVVSKLILAGIENAPPAALAKLSHTFAATLRTEPQIISVNNGETEDFAADRQFLWDNRYVLSPAIIPQHFAAPALHQALVRDMALLGSGMAPLVKQTIAADPTGELLALVNQFTAEAHPASRDGVWVSADGSRALMMIRTRGDGFDIDAEDATLKAIDRAFAAAKQTVPEAASATLVKTGPAVFAVDSRARMKRDATKFSIIATGLVAAILLAAYRSPRLLVLALLPVASGALAGVAAVSLGYGFVHGITLGFGVTLIGEAVDYAIYLFTQTPPGGKAADTLPRIWPTLRLGTMTSVCGFGAMLFSSFTGFAQLGLFTIAGLIVAVTVTRFVLPCLTRASEATARPPRFAGRLTAIAAHAPKLRWPLLALGLGAVVLLCMHRGPFWESELASLGALPPTVAEMDQSLRHDMGTPAIRYMVIIPPASQQQILDKSEIIAGKLTALVATGALAGFDSPTRYLPGTAAQMARQAALPAPETLRNNLNEALTDMPFQPDLFEPFLTDVESARVRPLLYRASLDGTSLALKLDSLLIQSGGGWSAMLPLTGVTRPDEIASAIGNDAILMDMKGESDQLLGRYLHEAITLALAGSLAICLLLAVNLRSARRVVTVLAPLAMAVLLTTCLLVLIIGKLSIFNLFGLLLTGAVGSNYCLFFERQEGDGYNRGLTVTSLVLANLCTVIGFGVLSFSGIAVLHGIGGTVAIGAFLSLISGAILIPPRRTAP